MPAAADEVWCYLDAEQKSQGPFPICYLQELNKCGYFNDATLFWKEGQGDWKRLKDLPHLQTSLQPSPPLNEPPANAAAPITASAAHITAAATPLDAPESPPPDERSFIDDDGTQYVWNSQLRKFQPVEGGAGGDVVPYTEEDMVFVPDADLTRKSKPEEPTEKAKDEDVEPTTTDNEPDTKTGGNNNTDKAEEARTAAITKAAERAKKAREAEEAKQKWFELKKNTSVYITGLPEDLTEHEMIETFSKCGIIKEDAVTGKPKVKIYRDPETQAPKGDGLVTYLKEPSVELAIQLLDGTPFKYGAPKNMSVSKAVFEQKGDKFVDKSGVSKKRKKQKVESQERALGWRGFDDVLKPQQITVIIKNMFHPEEFLKNPLAKEELEEDIMTEAKKLGTVNKIKLFSTNPEGVVSIKFTTEEAATTCVQKMNGRWFAGRQLKAEKWDGLTNYTVKIVETEEEQQARLEAYARELEASGGTDAAP